MSELSSAIIKPETTTRRAPGERLAWAFPLALLLPATALMLILYAWPFVASVYRSFVVEGGLTLANYEKAYELYFRDLVFSLEVAILTTVVSAVLSISLSAYVRLAKFIVNSLNGSS